MPSKDPLRSLANLTFLLTLFELWAIGLLGRQLRIIGSTIGWRQVGHVSGDATSVRCVRHPKVRAQDIHDGLSVGFVVVSQSLQSMEAPQPDRRFVATQLLDGLCIQLGDTSLCGIMRVRRSDLLLLRQVVSLQVERKLCGTLSTYREQQSQRRTSTRSCSQTSANRVSPRLRQRGPRQATALRPQHPSHTQTRNDNERRRSANPPPAKRLKPTSPRSRKTGSIRHDISMPYPQEADDKTYPTSGQVPLVVARLRVD